MKDDGAEGNEDLAEFERMIRRGLKQTAEKFARETQGMTDDQKREYVNKSLSRHKYEKEN